MIAVSPSRKSSPEISNFNLSNIPDASAYFLRDLVRPVLKPASAFLLRINIVRKKNIFSITCIVNQSNLNRYFPFHYPWK
jgi:uncharacterized protein (DUF1810 family)